MDDVTEWTEYLVRCRRWVRNMSGEKVWETVDLKACGEKQARKFYDDIKGNKMGSLEKPRIFVRTVVERPLET